MPSAGRGLSPPSQRAPAPRPPSRTAPNSATTVTPHTIAIATVTAGKAPKANPAATALVPETAIAAIVSVVRPRRSARRPARTQPMPPEATTANAAALASAGSPRPGRGEARGKEQRHPRPHRVELPHVAEVAKVRESDRRLSQRRPRDIEAEPRRGRIPWTSGSCREHQQPSDDGNDAGRCHRCPPVDALARADRAQQIRQRGTDREGPHEHPDRQAPLPAEPARKQLQPDRVDAGQGKPGDEAKRHGCHDVRCHEGEPEVGQRGDKRPGREQRSRGDHVGSGSGRNRERSDRETELDRDRKDGQAEPLESPFGAERGGNCRGAEPRRHRQQLAHGDDGQDPPASGGLSLRLQPGRPAASCRRGIRRAALRPRPGAGRRSAGG